VEHFMLMYLHTVLSLKSHERPLSSRFCSFSKDTVSVSGLKICVTPLQINRLEIDETIST
jgi:hypothetical protein